MERNDYLGGEIHFCFSFLTMNTVKNFSEWRAEQIVKLFLVSQQGIQVGADNNPFFDFTAYFEKPDKSVVMMGVSAIPTKYNRQEISKKLSKVRHKILATASKVKLPVTNFYINIDSEQGYFEVIQPDQLSSCAATDSIHRLSRASFQEELSHL